MPTVRRIPLSPHETPPEAGGPSTEGLPTLETPQEQHPRVYRHTACGAETQMPEGIQTNYLADPCFYGEDTICVECGPVPDSTCVWVETGETVRDYLNRLVEEKSMAYHLVRWLMPFFFGCLGVLWLELDPMGWYQGPEMSPNAAEGFFLIGACLSFFVGHYVRIVLCFAGLI